MFSEYHDHIQGFEVGAIEGGITGEGAEGCWSKRLFHDISIAKGLSELGGYFAIDILIVGG